MARVKGCMSEKCATNQKKIIYKEADDDYCSKCGNKLNYVCKDCYTQLPDDNSEKYCVRCLAKRQDLKDHALEIVGSVAAVGIAAVGGTAKIFKGLSKLK